VTNGCLYIFDDRRVILSQLTADEAIMTAFYLLKFNEDEIYHEKFKTEAELEELINDLEKHSITGERDIELALKRAEKMANKIEVLEEILKVIKTVSKRIKAIEE